MQPKTTALIGGLALALSVGPVAADDLLDVLRDARDSDPTLRAADYDRLAAAENERQAIGNFLPTVDAFLSKTEGDNERDFLGLSEDLPDTDREFWQVQLRQPIYRRSNYGLLDQGRAQSLRGVADYDAAEQDFLLRVAEAYFSVLTAIDRLVFARAEEQAVGRQLDQAEQRFEVGLTAITDVHEAKARYDNARARVIVAENDLNDRVEGLREITGKEIYEIAPLQATLPFVPPDPAEPEVWVQRAIDDNPTVASARLSAEIAEANIKLQRAGHWPTLDAVVTRSNNVNGNQVFFDDDGSIGGTTSVESDTLEWSLQLNVPLFEGGNVSSRSRQARYAYEAAMERFDTSLRATVRSTRNNFRGTLASISEVEAREQALISAQAALEATQAGFEVGTRTIVDVLLSQQQLFQAQQDFSVARHEYLLNHLRLRRSAGNLNEEHLARVNQLLITPALPTDPEEISPNMGPNANPSANTGSPTVSDSNG